MNFKLVIFDLDGTLAESKQALGEELASLLCRLLERLKVAVISGAAISQFARQFLSRLKCPPEHLVKLLVLPLSGSELYDFAEGEWRLLHSTLHFSPAERQKIFSAVNQGLREVPFALPREQFGPRIENRGSQITFSALGQEAPLVLKKQWDPDHKKRARLAEVLSPLLPEFEVMVGGSTSVDITRKGANKATAVTGLLKRLGLVKTEALYVGDDLFPGGNDHIVTSLGLPTISVKGPVDTARVIKGLLVP